MDMRRNCDNCVSKKVKCDGRPGQDCNYCVRKGKICIFSPKQKPGPKGSGGSDPTPQSIAPEAIPPLPVPCNPSPVLVLSSTSSDSSSDSGGSSVYLGGGSIDLSDGSIESGGDSGGGGGGGVAAGAGAPSAGGGAGGVGVGGGGALAAAGSEKAPGEATSPSRAKKGKGRPKKSSLSAAGGVNMENHQVCRGGGGLAIPSPGGNEDEHWGPAVGRQQLRRLPLPAWIENPCGKSDGPNINVKSGGGGAWAYGDHITGSGSGNTGSGKPAARMGTMASGGASSLDGRGFAKQGGYVGSFNDRDQQQMLKKKRSDPPAGVSTDDIVGHRSKRQQIFEAEMQQQQQELQQQQQPQLSRVASDTSTGSWLNFLRESNSFLFPDHGDGGATNNNGNSNHVGDEVVGGEVGGGGGGGGGGNSETGVGTSGDVLRAGIAPPSSSLGSSNNNAGHLPPAGSCRPLSPPATAAASGETVRLAPCDIDNPLLEPVWMTPCEERDRTPPRDTSLASCSDWRSLTRLPLDDFIAATTTSEGWRRCW